MKIGIDPGHGGKDPGAIGPSGLYEKIVNLDVATYVKYFLESAGHQVVMTRTEDRYVDLPGRTNLLNSTKCDIAVSIHANSFTQPEPDYMSVFIQAPGGEAEKLAQRIQSRVVEATGWPDGGVRVSNLHMTRETKMPAVVVELGFISNPEQEKQLADHFFQWRLADAIALGILDYVGKGDFPVKVIVKGTEIPGQLIEGKTWVPLREFVDAWKPEIIWNEKDKSVVVK